MDKYHTERTMGRSTDKSPPGKAVADRYPNLLRFKSSIINLGAKGGGGRRGRRGY